jgi:outer membrane protein OmpA-like peptidoglycan-associated protein
LWFNFDRLLFDTGKTTLKPASMEQVEKTIAILNAFPSVKIKIGGYTDNKGDAKANMKLSADRANVVMNALIKGGIDKARLAAEGYGDQHPVASNDTEEGRSQNRRIGIRVTEK